ncbi:MAG: dihydropteroate synthase [Armatimonadetes bacterium]|nr:dihydropteroate synthase [Armatimonadota bacterium]
MALGQRTLVMGIINVTPDSFSGDGLAGRVDAAVSQGVAFVEAGADILDVGGESTRPGSDPVSAEEELSRVSDVIRELSGAVDVPISIDTQKPVVAKRAIELGASIVNDVYGLRAPGMLDVVADAGVGVVIMHMLGQPKTMQVAPRYGDFMKEICDFLRERIEAATAAGVDFEAIAVDPGFGFGKTVGHNLEMLRRLRELHSLGRPVVIGTSRKSTIGLVLDKPVEERLWGTAATCAIAIANGAHVIRVHDVREMVDVARMSDAVVYGWEHDDTS